MKKAIVPLTPTLSEFSWKLMELFILFAVFFLPFSKSIAETAILIALGVFVLRKTIHGEPLLYYSSCTVAYWLFIFLVAISLTQVAREHLFVGCRGFLKWFEYIGVCYMSAEVFRDKERREHLFYTFLISMALICLNGFYQLVTGFDLVRHYAADVPGRFIRMRSSFQAPNDFGTFLLLAAPLAGGMMIREERWTKKRIIIALFFVLFLACLVASLSRAAFFAMIIAASFYGLLQGKKRYILWIVLGAAVLVSSSGTLRENFVSSLNAKDITINERARFWGITVEMIKAKPWLGHGTNMYMKKFPEFADPDEKYLGYAHNSYLQILSELGIFAFLLFLYPLIRIMWRDAVRVRATAVSMARRGQKFVPHMQDFIWVGFIAYLIQSAVDTNFYAFQTALIFWILWGSFLNAERRSPEIK